LRAASASLRLCPRNTLPRASAAAANASAREWRARTEDKDVMLR